MVRELDILHDFISPNGNRNLLITDSEEVISKEDKVKLRHSITFIATPDTEGGVNDLNIVAMAFTSVLDIDGNLISNTIASFEHKFKKPLKGELSIRRAGGDPLGKEIHVVRIS